MDIRPAVRTRPAATSATNSSRVNHLASAISPGCGVISLVVARAAQPIISEAGKGQGWSATYSTSATCTPVSSATSRATAPAKVSPGSTNPARTEKRPSGQVTLRPSSIRSASSVTAMMTAGSVRG